MDTNNCDVSVSINYSSPNNKLEFVSDPNGYFTNIGNVLNSNNPFPSNVSFDFQGYFKFQNHTTCDGEIGTFTITFTTCDTSCVVTVNITARAANYWTIKKSFATGNLTCGTSQWKINIDNNNPNPNDFGNYQIQGTITENPVVPVLANAVTSVYASTFHSPVYVTLQNCQNEGTQITNTANYNFNLGDGCGIMTGDITAISTPLQSPNADISFTKEIFSNDLAQMNRISPGCGGHYKIQVKNIGNVPWQINSITDTIPNDITIIGVSNQYATVGIQSGMWLSTSNSLNSSLFTFTPPSSSPVVLNPGESKEIHFFFTVNSNAPIGSTITNSAHLNYQAIGVGGNSSSGSNNTNASCPGVICPSVDSTILNTDADVEFIVVEPQPLEIFKKCVVNQPPGNIYAIGDIVRFRYIIANKGSGNLTTSIMDNLGLPNQNLEVIPSSISYTFYEDIYYNWANSCTSFSYLTPTPITFPITNNINPLQNLSNLQNPIFNITDLPGNCDFNRANALVIEFDTKVLIQIYGNKVNTAYTNMHQSSASYTIDQFGVLSVDKRADKEFVENGETFNYIIEVTNNGSVPLDNVSISDQIPSCVQLGELIDAKDFAGNSININLGGTPSALQISLPSTWQLMPGQTATFTIQATKTGGGTCCNESVTANGTMITSGVVLNAIDGSASEPAACVKSTKCCDIQDFEASLYENADGSYSVEINGGAVPIQQVDIAVIDYHLEYNQRDCQPQDMGNFGQLSTNRPLLNGLTFETNTNNTSNLTWLPGNPDVMNTSVNFNITKPNVLDLECCDVDFYFCIKVTVKDVNCNVCEKVICPEPYVEPEPCAITVRDVKSEYCTNDTININWSGANSSGNVNVYLVPDNGGSPIQIASNQPETGSLNWSIPAFTSPKQCDKNWKILVVDTSDNTCGDLSMPFLIKCCEEKCECGAWRTNVVRIEQKITVVDSEYLDYEISKEKKHTKNPILEPFGQYEIKCGGSLELKKGSYQITSPMYGCEGDCRATYRWILRDLSTGQVTHGVGNTFNHNFNYSGKFKLVFIPECGGNECGGCEIIIAIN